MSYFFFQALTGFELLCVVLIACAWPARFRKYLPFVVLCATVVTAIYGFRSHCAGRILFSDDHPAFLYRLSQLVENFPAIPFYNPLWNGGVEAREFFPSGILGIFLLTSPILYLFPVEAVYNYIVLGILFIIVPSVGFLTARLAQLGQFVASVTAVLMMCGSLLWYRWALTYGTMGFLLSASLSPLLTLLIIKTLDTRRNTSYTEYALLIVVFSLTAFWTPSLLLLTPLLITGATRLLPLLRKRGFLVAAGITTAINLPWLLLFIEASNVFAFVTSEQTSHGNSAKKIAVAKFSANLWSYFITTAPLLIAGALPGLKFIFSYSWGALYALMCVWSLLMGICGPYVIPQLELDRFLVVANLLLALPVAAWVAQLLGEMPCGQATSQEGLAIGRMRRLWSTTSRALGLPIIIFLLLLPSWVWRIVTNQTVITFALADGSVRSLTDTLKQLDGDGRILFSGFVLHELSGGHVAPLAYLTKRPLVASRYQHDRWAYTNIIPDAYLNSGEKGIEEYFTLLNVSHVLAHEQFWRTWFSGRPDRYKPLGAQGRFSIFKRVSSSSSYFISGAGEVISQDSNSVHLRLDETPAVIKFNFNPHLTSSNCSLAPYKVSQDLTFIELKNCQAPQEVTLRAISPVKRLRKLFTSSNFTK
jgi:hypothetical protein